MNILLVEDDETICLGYQKRIIKMNIPQITNVFKAFSAEEALIMLEKEPVDLLITDIHMYDMDGLELIQEVRKKKTEIICIIITAYDSFEYAQQAIRLNVEDFLLKPCTFEEMKAVIYRAVTRFQMTYSLRNTIEEKIIDPIAWACNYTKEHIEEDIDMAFIANHLNLSYSYFSKLFKERTGRTYSDYLLEEKMKKAGKLLDAGMKTIEVSQALGYQHVQNFSRAFYKYWKMTTSTYKKR